MSAFSVFYLHKFAAEISMAHIWSQFAAYDHFKRTLRTGIMKCNFCFIQLSNADMHFGHIISPPPFHFIFLCFFACNIVQVSAKPHYYVYDIAYNLIASNAV